MPDLAHIATSLATDPLAGLLLAISLSIALIILAQRLWWIHALLAAFLLILSLAFHDKRHLSFDSYLVGLFAFAAVSRDIPNQLSHRHFLVCVLRADLGPHLRCRRTHPTQDSARKTFFRAGNFSSIDQEGHLI